MKNVTLVLLVLLLTITGFGQVNSKAGLLKIAETYYQSLNTFTTSVMTRYSNSFIVDTPVFHYSCYVDKGTNRAFFGYNPERGYLVEDGKEFAVNLKDKEVLPVKSKGSIYNSQFRYFPFIDLEGFLGQFGTELLDFREVDTAYFLTGKTWTVEFRKNGSVRRAARQEYEPQSKTSVYNEWNFSECNPPAENPEAVAFASMVTGIKNWPEAKKPEQPARRKADNPKHFDREQFSRAEVAAMLGGISLEGKTILLDVFFQGCYPCVLAYPYIEEIYQHRDSGLVVIGMDSFVKDSATLEAYRKKHNINYPVISGEAAHQFTQQLGVAAWPSFIVIDPDGKITDYRTGFSKELLERIKKKFGVK